MNITLIARTTYKRTSKVTLQTITYTADEYGQVFNATQRAALDAGKPVTIEDSSHIKDEVVNASALALAALA